MLALVRPVGFAYSGVWAGTASGLIGGLLVPGLAEGARGALALPLTVGGHRTPAIAAAILTHNAGTALWPLALVLARVHTVPVARRMFDTAVVSSLTANGAVVGLAIAAYGCRLLPFLVHLPLEWLGLALPAAAWSQARRDASSNTRALVVAAAVALTVLIAAAWLEVYATPG